MQLSVSHFWPYKQPLTYIPIGNNSNNNNRFISSPSWTLVVSVLWSIVYPLSGVSSHMLHLTRKILFTHLWHWLLASTKTWACTREHSQMDTYVHPPNTHTNKYLKKISKAGMIISIKIQEITQSDSAGIILIIYLLKFQAWIICSKSLMVIACIMH